MTNRYAALLDSDDGSAIIYLSSETLADAKVELKSTLMAESEQVEDRDDCTATWFCDIGTDGDYEWHHDAKIVQLCGPEGNVPIEDWQEEIREWEERTSKELDMRSSFDDEKEEFDAIEKRYHELRHKYEADVSVSSGKPTKKKILKRKKKAA